MHRALYAFFHHCASRFVRRIDIAVEMIVVRAATARANKFRETAFAFFAGEKAGIFEFFTKFGTGNPFKYATHAVVFVARKLMAGV